VLRRNIFILTLALFLPLEASALEVVFTDAGAKVVGAKRVTRAEKKVLRKPQGRAVLATSGLSAAVYTRGRSHFSSSTLNKEQSYFGNVAARRSTFSYTRNRLYRSSSNRPVRPFLSSGFRAASYSFRQSALRGSSQIGRYYGRAAGSGRF